MKTLYRTPEPGTAGLFRTSEPKINPSSTFAKAPGAPAPQNSTEANPVTRFPGLEARPLAATGSDPLGRGVSPNPGPDNQEGERKRKRRYLLLLLLLLISFSAFFVVTGGFGLFGGDDIVAPSTPKQPEVVAAPNVEVKSEPAKPAAEEPKETAPPATKPDEAPKTEIEPIEPILIPDRIADVQLPVTQYDISYPEPVAPPARSVRSKTNFVAFEVSAKLQEDPETRVFSMVPGDGFGGTGTLLWSTMTGAVVFRTKDLAANRPGSNYVLYYINDQKKAQRMMSFSVASGAELMLIPPRIPSRNVQRVVLTLESTIKTKEGDVTRRDEVLYSDYKEKVAVMKPLK